MFQIEVSVVFIILSCWYWTAAFAFGAPWNFSLLLCLTNWLKIGRKVSVLQSHSIFGDNLKEKKVHYRTYMASSFRKWKCSEISGGSVKHWALSGWIPWTINTARGTGCAETFPSSAQALTGSDHTLEMPWPGRGDQIIMRLKLYHYWCRLERVMTRVHSCFSRAVIMLFFFLPFPIYLHGVRPSEWQVELTRWFIISSFCNFNSAGCCLASACVLVHLTLLWHITFPGL